MKSTMPIDSEKMSLVQAAKYLNIGRQAVYFALWRNKLRADKIGLRWWFKQIYLDEYRLNRHSRSHFFQKDEISVADAAVLLDCPKMHVYYAINSKQLKYSRNGGNLIIQKRDLVDYKRTRFNKKTKLCIDLK